jgi:alpha-glucosidase (family GH31 glycosyl hydrolase)
MLAFEVPFTSTAGNVGCFFWSHDIGGHNRGRNEESYARWCQFGAFSAALRSHSTRDPQMDRRPWTYPQWAEDSMRASFHLRSRFFPYTYSSVHESSAESIPLLRPMYLEYPASEEAYRQPQQYFYGDNVLVAPVAEAGAGPRRLGRQVVWFPGGRWFNFFSGERFEGGQERLVAATIDEFPLYIRGGVPVPMQPYTQRMTSTPLTNVAIRCYPGEDG